MLIKVELFSHLARGFMRFGHLISAVAHGKKIVQVSGVWREKYQSYHFEQKWGFKYKISQNGCIGENRRQGTLDHDLNRLWSLFESKGMATFWENRVYAKLGFSKFTKTTIWPYGHNFLNFES